jgi:hypothetical protein
MRDGKFRGFGKVADRCRFGHLRIWSNFCAEALHQSRVGKNMQKLPIYYQVGVDNDSP